MYATAQCPYTLIFTSFDFRWGIDWNAMKMKRKMEEKNESTSSLPIAFGSIAATAAAGAPATARSLCTFYRYAWTWALDMTAWHTFSMRFFLSLLCFAVFFLAIAFGSINDWNNSMHLQQIQYIIVIWWHRCIINGGVAPLREHRICIYLI